MTEATMETVTSQAHTLKLNALRDLELKAMLRFHRAVKDMQFAQDFEDVDEFYAAATRADMASKMAAVYADEIADYQRMQREGWVMPPA